jgi:hypothetical protein
VKPFFSASTGNSVVTVKPFFSASTGSLAITVKPFFSASTGSLATAKLVLYGCRVWRMIQVPQFLTLVGVPSYYLSTFTFVLTYI